MYHSVIILPAGDTAVSVELGDIISAEVNFRVRNLMASIERSKIAGVVDLVPSYRSLLIYYDPLVIPYAELVSNIRSCEVSLSESRLIPKIVEIPTVYGGGYGPDLDYVATSNGITTDEVILLHSSNDYLIYMMGFRPGFTYLGGMSEKIATPRLQTPRLVIPAGSVGIAEQQTGIYPIESPGGWQIIGRTPINIFDPERDPPVIADAGDYVRFVPVSEKEYLETKSLVEERIYRLVTLPFI